MCDDFLYKTGDVLVMKPNYGGWILRSLFPEMSRHVAFLNQGDVITIVSVHKASDLFCEDYYIVDVVTSFGTGTIYTTIPSWITQWELLTYEE